jgi:hypothetical protein
VAARWSPVTAKKVAGCRELGRAEPAPVPRLLIPSQAHRARGGVELARVQAQLLAGNDREIGRRRTRASSVVEAVRVVVIARCSGITNEVPPGTRRRRDRDHRSERQASSCDAHGSKPIRLGAVLVSRAFAFGEHLDDVYGEALRRSATPSAEIRVTVSGGRGNDDRARRHAVRADDRRRRITDGRSRPAPRKRARSKEYRRR